MTTAKSPLYKLNNGIEMPALGFGVFRSEPEETVAAVRSAVADGYRLVGAAAAQAGAALGKTPTTILNLEFSASRRIGHAESE